jgi:hypothetical protein
MVACVFDFSISIFWVTRSRTNLEASWILLQILQFQYYFFYTQICSVSMFVNCEGCRSEVIWNNRKQLLKSIGELNAMLVLLSFFLFGRGLCYYLIIFYLLFMQSSYSNWSLMMMHCLEYYSFFNVLSRM